MVLVASQAAVPTAAAPAGPARKSCQLPRCSTAAAPCKPKQQRRLVENCCAHEAQAAAAAASGLSTRRNLLIGAGLVSLLEALLPVEAAKSTEGISKVFVAGATGNTGRRVVSALRAAGYEVRAGVRDIKKAQGLGLALDSGVQLVVADVLKPQASLEEAIGDAQAVICATGYTGFLPKGFGDVDETGSINLINAAKARGVKHYVLCSSLLTNATAVGQQDNPNYKFLNMFGQVLDHKLVAEKYLRSSGLTWTIVRPGGLSNDPAAEVGNLIARPEDTLFGLDSDPGRQISRDTVAEVLVAALAQPSAQNRLVEVVSSPTAPALPQDKWFPA